MADDITTRDNLRVEKSATEQLSIPAGTQGGAMPLPKNPGLLRHIIELNKHIFGDFYNTFRLTGYLAEGLYSQVHRGIGDQWPGLIKPKDKGKPFHSVLWRSDWASKPRAIVNAIEAVAFMGGAFYAFIRDRRKFRNEIGDVVAAELGKDPTHLQMRDILASENPIIQTATNRLKALYILRFGQPLTLLYSLSLGIITTVTEIVAERAAYFEKNSYDHLQRLMREVSNNQWGAWSRDALVAQLINVIQETRTEHKAPPVGMSELQTYSPLLQKMADRMIEKKLRFADVLYVLGQVIKEPAAPEKAFKAFDELEAHGLSALAKLKLSGKSDIGSSPLEAMPQQQDISAAAYAHNPENQLAGGGFLSRIEGKRNNINDITIPPSSHVEKIVQENKSVAAHGIA